MEGTGLSSLMLLVVAALMVIVWLVGRAKGKGKRVLQSFMAQLVDTKEVTHDTKILTFLKPQQMALKVGQHLEVEAQIKGKLESRKYTPISRTDLKSDTFKLLIKVYRPCPQFPHGGLMSQHLQAMKLGDKIKTTHPFGKFNYQGHCQTLKYHLDTSIKRKYNNIYMIAGGTGITPLYQIIQYVCQVQAQEGPNMTILFANKSQDDILLKEELQHYMNGNPKFKCYFSVDKAINKETWKGLQGFVTAEKVKQTLGYEVKDTLFLVCGPPILCNLSQKFYLELKAKENQIHRF